MEQIQKSYYEMIQPFINSYYENNAKKLHSVVDKIFNKYYGGTINKDMDEFYGVATDVVMEIRQNQTYDPSKSDFDAYLYRAILFGLKSEFKKRTCDKRATKIEEKDENGNLILDKNGKPKRIAIPDIRIDAPLKDNGELTFGDTLSSDFNIDDVISNNLNDEKMKVLLNSMTKTQRQFIELKLNNISIQEIREKLGLSNREYLDIIKNIKENDNWKLFKKDSIKYMGEPKMQNVKSKNNIITIEIVDNVIPLEYADNVIPLDLSDNYRMDKVPLKNLIDDMNSNKINRNYILQREACQWTPRQVNKYLTRVLNAQPIPEIVICEQKVKGKKRSHLIDGLQRLSYSSLFMSDKLTIGTDGAEFFYIPYKEYLYDDEGNVILDEEGDAKFKLKLFNVIGKKFSEFPQFIKTRFEKFNVNVTTYFNCTDAQIAYHIRNYNNQEGMNKNQYEFTEMDIKIAEKIKNISKKHPFFNDCCGKYTNKNKAKGEVDRVVIESLMTTNFLDNWKKEVKDSFSYVNDNVTDDMFLSFTNTLDRLYQIVDKDIKDVFTTTNSSIWFAVFEKFKTYNIPDEKFKDFILYIKDNMDHLVFENTSFKEIYKNKSTRDKKIVIGKINMLLYYMKQFFQISENKNDIESSFIMEEFNMSIDEFNKDISFYKATLDDLTSKTIRDGSKLLDEQNQSSLLAMVIYSFENDVDLEKWLTNYAECHSTYNSNQHENYKQMKQDFEKYQLNKEGNQ